MAVVAFQDAPANDTDLLGGKGDSLATMSRLGLPVPPGFIVSTDICRTYLREGAVPSEVWIEIGRQLTALENRLDRRFGNLQAPLLLSVRSGAPVSMPGMMDTILNLGLTDLTVDGLAAMIGDEAFAWDSYSRLVRMYGVTVRGMAGADFERLRMRVGRDHAERSTDFGAALTRAYQQALEAGGTSFPQDPLVQLRAAVEAVFRSWNSPRAVRYRRYANLDDSIGTAVVVQAMVFGNLPGASGTGVAFTRDPANGAPGGYGDFLANAQGEDVVAGEHAVSDLADLQVLAPDAASDLTAVMHRLEDHYRDLMDIEFTVEHGTLWVLQTRIGHRTAAAAVRVALDLIDEGAITLQDALDRIPPRGLIDARRPVLDDAAARTVLGRGTAASPGAAVGRVALSSLRAEEYADRGDPVILVRPVTSPDDIAGMIASAGIVTALGGRTSHAAVVARGMNRPAVCGVGDLQVGDDHAMFGDTRVEEGQTVSLDGGCGAVYAGAVPFVQAAPDPRIDRLLEASDARRQLPLLATSPQPWADDVLPPDGVTVITDLADHPPPGVETRVVLDVGDAAEPRTMLEAAVEATAQQPLLLRVGPDWPAQVTRLPQGSWAGLLVDDGGEDAARLLAATASIPHSTERAGA